MQSSYATYKELDSQIGYVAMKVVHLGDLLESVNTPRSRAVEAQKLMKHFAEFLRPEHGSHTGISMTQPRFEKARFKIAQKYNEIEKALIAEFVRAHHEGDKETMRQVAAVLSHFRLSSNLSKFKMGNDPAFLKKLTRQIFSKHLDPYLSIEMQYLRDKCCTVLNRYYESKNHHKRQFQFGGSEDM
ncbi:hypothetical protein HPB52_024678 [Rhipicephalus sanguineus]|uniref:Exocyst complex component 5 n=1 Tax=Rhipicephalus sanguineus TaxID=34632 RepID=A0A9D4TE41_RHISA|nr:hypothetical protein HPB52_024678 [Rhipicephalus sanguineus]